jgi:ubiquinone/menaquinone biosynthesis C-methylase UbiE
LDEFQQLSLRQVLSQPALTSVLEIGCGSGRYLVHLIRSLPGADVVGVDVSESALKKAARALEGEARGRLVHAAVEDLPLPDDTFDVVVANKSFHHWSDWQLGLREASRVLRPGGTLIIADALAAGAIERPWLKRLAELLDGGRFVDGAAFDHMLDAAGFETMARIPVPRSAGTLYITVAKSSDKRSQPTE